MSTTSSLLSPSPTLSPTNTTTSNDEAQMEKLGLIVLHGLSMFVAFGVLPIGAIFAARYLQKKKYWLWLHGGLNLVVAAVVAFGLVLIEAEVDRPFAFKSAHGTLGVLIALVMLPAQVGVVPGFGAGSEWRHNMGKRPAYHKVLIGPPKESGNEVLKAGESVLRRLDDIMQEYRKKHPDSVLSQTDDALVDRTDTSFSMGSSSYGGPFDGAESIPLKSMNHNRAPSNPFTERADSSLGGGGGSSSSSTVPGSTSSTIAYRRVIGSTFTPADHQTDSKELEHINSAAYSRYSDSRQSPTSMRKHRGPPSSEDLKTLVVERKVSTPNRAVNRVFFDEPEEESDVLVVPMPMPVRIIHAEPEEDDADDAFVPKPRIIHAEPEDEEEVVLPKPRIIHAEPEDEEDVFVAPLKPRVIHAEPEDEVEEVVVPKPRVFYAEPEDDNIPLPTNCIIHAEPEEDVDRIVSKSNRAVNRIFFDEPEEDDLESIPLPPRVIHAEPEEEDVDRLVTKSNRAVHRVVFEEPEEEDVDRIVTKSNKAVHRIVFEEPEEEDVDRIITKSNRAVHRVVFEEPEEEDVDRIVTKSNRAVHRVVFDEPEEEDLSAFSGPARILHDKPKEVDRNVSASNRAVHRVVFDEPEEEDFSSVSVRQQRVIHSEPDEDVDREVTKSNRAVHRVVFEEPGDL
ncbi:hypothetical protein HDU79_010323 [Rhizoclosmatium sp. JEL0117]|nr:hypothetical protein HDU79_010323 [Rhizoclosmatium sp. JEL0117]